MKSTVNFFSAGLQALLAEGIMDVTLTSKVYIWPTHLTLLYG